MFLDLQPIASCIDFKNVTLAYNVVIFKQPVSILKHLKLKSIHINTPHNNQLL